MHIVVIGTGFVGGVIAEAMAAGGHAVRHVSARRLLAGERIEAPACAACFFAHGKGVGVPRFAAHFDDLLASRTQVLREAAASPCMTGGARHFLISSTVACMPPAEEKNLSALQHGFEAAFRQHFPAGAIVRAGAVFGAGSQLEQGLPLLAKTRLLKRLRMNGTTDIPWIERAQLAALCLRLAVSGSGASLAAANAQGFDINALLDRAYDGRWKLRLPRGMFLALYAALGMPRQFAEMSMESVRRSGWAIASA